MTCEWLGRIAVVVLLVGPARAIIVSLMLASLVPVLLMLSIPLNTTLAGSVSLLDLASSVGLSNLSACSDLAALPVASHAPVLCF